MKTHVYDAIIIGGGGAGLYAALEVGQQAKVAVISKLYPSRSHTGAAQGGVAAVLANLDEDHVDWHMYDTVKGGDYLVDQKAAEILVSEAMEVIYDLEHKGLPFSRNEDGSIAQRKFGGHTRNFGEGPIRRSCFSADRTGHMILHTLYQQCIKHNIEFYNEFIAIELLMNGTQACGVICFELRTGLLHRFHAKAVMFATGGFGRMFKITSNAYANTGDGPALIARAGIPLMDMEFFQFHPTGLHRIGVLVTEGARGEGGILRNNTGEPFMERYAPTLKDLAPRDMVSRSIIQEIRAGRGLQGDRSATDYVHLDLTHLGAEKLSERLPDISDFCRTYVGVEPSEQSIPIQPTAHYSMGGIPVNVHGEVWAGKHVYDGLFAAGECSCVSVHGANRLGTNSLLDIVVYGRRTGRRMLEYIKGCDMPTLHNDAGSESFAYFDLLKQKSQNSVNIGDLYSKLQETMQMNVGVFRNQADMIVAQKEVSEVREQVKHIRLGDNENTFNTDFQNIFELRNLSDLALLTAVGAENRQESRGGHAREDYTERDDANFLVHTLAYLPKDGQEVQLDMESRPVEITKFEPKARTY